MTAEEEGEEEEGKEHEGAVAKKVEAGRNRRSAWVRRKPAVATVEATAYKSA